MQPPLVCLFHIMRPLTHPPIQNTDIVPVFENTSAPIVVHVLCLLHHSSGPVLNPMLFRHISSMIKGTYEGYKAWKDQYGRYVSEHLVVMLFSNSSNVEEVHATHHHAAPL